MSWLSHIFRPPVVEHYTNPIQLKYLSGSYPFTSDKWVAPTSGEFNIVATSVDMHTAFNMRLNAGIIVCQTLSAAPAMHQIHWTGQLLKGDYVSFDSGSSSVRATIQVMNAHGGYSVLSYQRRVRPAVGPAHSNEDHYLVVF